MRKYMKLLFLYLVMTGINAEIITAVASKKIENEDFDPEMIQMQLGVYYKDYYREKQKEAELTDTVTVTLKHPQAKKRKRTQIWPVVSRSDFFSILEDTEKQIETLNTLFYEDLRTISSIHEINEEAIEEEKDFLCEQARIVLLETGFCTREKELITLTQFKNYLTKNKPLPVFPSTTLEGFMKYLAKDNYQIPEGYKKKAKIYLTEYFFPSEEGN